MTPDYSIYPQYDFAVCMTSRGCPRGCAFCHVAAKEGRCSRKVADVSDMWTGQKRIQCLDPNLTACKDKRELFRQYMETGAYVEFNQGLDIRLLNDDDIADLNSIKLQSLHFAWDNPNDDLYPKFQYFAENFHRKMKNLTQVFVLTNFEEGLTVDEHVERALYRIYKIRDLGMNPYLMVYDRPHCDRQFRLMQRWCNNKFVFRACKDFKDYNPRMA